MASSPEELPGLRRYQNTQIGRQEAGGRGNLLERRVVTREKHGTTLPPGSGLRAQQDLRPQPRGKKAFQEKNKALKRGDKKSAGMEPLNGPQWVPLAGQRSTVYRLSWTTQFLFSKPICPAVTSKSLVSRQSL